MEDIAIKVDNVSKSFKLPHERHSTIKSSFINVFRGKRTYEKQDVLKNVSLEIKKGDFFGIVGRNGSGKSTLLKLLAGIYSPNEGAIQINGKLIPFIELGVGFNQELTGSENVFLNGSLLGFSREEMENMYDEIVEFAELEKFMDQKLKNYSSGMQVRLAFSIAIRAKSDILVLDEVLAVGDEAFQKKCYQYFAEIKRQKQTVILVTHSMDAIQQFCNKAALIDKGHKTVVGNPLKITQIYRELNSQDGETAKKIKHKSEKSTKYVSARMKHTKSKGKHIFDISLKPKVTIEDPIIAMGIYRDTGEQVYRWTSDEKVPFKLKLKTHNQVKIEIANIFPVGFFTVSLFIKKRDRTMNYATFDEMDKFEVKNLTPYNDAVFWKVPEDSFINGEKV